MPQIDDLEFDGFPIVRRKVKVTGAGDGLSDSMRINSHHLVAGDTGVMVLRFKVKGATMEPTKETKDDEEPEYQRVDNLVAQSATIVEGAGIDAIELALKEHEAQVAEMKRRDMEAKKGIERLPLAEDEAQKAEDGAEPTGE